MTDLRAARLDDLPWMVEWSEAHQRAHVARHPVEAHTLVGFAEHVQARQEHLVTDPEAIALVAEAGGTPRGFLLARLVTAPPVYAPGGPVCFTEDFAAASVADWPTVGAVLLAEAEQRAKARGAVLMVAVCQWGDLRKPGALEFRGYTVASEWYAAHTSLGRYARALAGLPTVRLATAGDVGRMLEIGERKRREYEAYQPVFWKVAAVPRETFAPYINPSCYVSCSASGHDTVSQHG